MDKDNIEQEEIAPQVESLFPGYQNHVYKSAIEDEKSKIAPERIPTSFSEGRDMSDEGY